MSTLTEPATEPLPFRRPFRNRLSLRGEARPHRQVDPGADGGVLHEEVPERRGQGEHRHRSQRQRLRALLHHLSIQPLPVTLERALWLDALDWLAKYADEEPDWADACLAVLSGRDKNLRVWTYDREFRTTWRRPNGTPIPLAVSPT